MASLNLLAVQCKKAEPVDLRDPVYKYVAHTYSDQQAKDASDDLAAVQEERNEISGLVGSLSSLAATLHIFFSEFSSQCFEQFPSSLAWFAS